MRFPVPGREASLPGTAVLDDVIGRHPRVSGKDLGMGVDVVAGRSEPPKGGAVHEAEERGIAGGRGRGGEGRE